MLSIDKADATPAETVLSITDLHVKDDRDLGAVNGFTLDVRAGEIVGVAGVEGNGQRELVEALAGMRKVVSGTMTLGDLDLTRANPHETHHAGVGHIPEDREKHGLVASYSIADNLVLNEFDQAPYAKNGVRQFDAVTETPRGCARSSTSGPTASTRPRRRSRVATSRRSSWPARCRSGRGCSWPPSPPVASTSGRSSSSTGGSSTPATPGPRCSSSRPSSTRSSRCRDRIAVVHGGKVVAEMPGRDADRTEIGRLMAGDH